MKKMVLVLFLAIISTFLSGCLSKKQLAALQVNSLPTASVFLNGKLAGKTPFSDTNMNPGEITIKLIPESTTSALSSWEGKIKLVGGVKSIVSREFAETEEGSSGDILTLEPIRDKKTASLAVVTSPDGAVVMVDAENRGFSPLVLEKISEGERQITLSLEGYKERILKARAINGYKLIINSSLAKEGETDLEITPTGSLTPSPTGKSIKSPTSTPKPKVTLPAGQASIIVKGTPDGWLRVREEASSQSKELARVNEGDEFTLLDEENGWYKINYAEGKEGWISGQYAKKQ